ncbi:uncharacterized protein LOC143636469 [Bidens hawaiensis]|uniref:uncharacterized protein LOC143636469 n=1 Tax=Bidens hawaiensis TaxID=980011 RepID=UPI00404AA1A0
MMNQHTISFRSGGVNSTSEMIMMGHYNPVNSTATRSTRLLGSSCAANNNSSGFTQYGSSCGSVFGDSVSGLKHDAGLAVEWSVEEQNKLNEGLSRFADESSIMRYIKIAATLNDKTVRDVAMRCRWMARKRKKTDEPHMAKRSKDKDKKDNLVVSSSKPSMSSVPKLDVAPFSIAMNNRDQIDDNTFEALCGSIKELVEQNSKVLGQISANISSMKLQDNINLFNHTKDNITAILNDMRYVPGPPFRVSLNEDLPHNILPHSPTNQVTTF